jgi:hypothetical protein
MNRRCAASLFLVSIMLYGCASNSPPIATDQWTIEKVTSEQTDIDSITVRKADNGIVIAGTIRFAHRMMGSPAGYMEVTILDPDGKVLYTAQSGYYRYGRPVKESDAFNFSLKIPAEPPKGGIVRLVHHASS